MCRKYKKRCLRSLVLSTLLFLGLPSCAPVLFVGGAVVGAGTYSYLIGEVETSERATVEEAYNAALVALKKLRLEVLDSEYDALSGKIEAERIDEGTIIINFKRKNINLTQISVRVGLLGEKEDGQTVLNAILAEIDNR